MRNDSLKNTTFQGDLRFTDRGNPVRNISEPFLDAVRPCLFLPVHSIGRPAPLPVGGALQAVQHTKRTPKTHRTVAEGSVTEDAMRHAQVGCFKDEADLARYRDHSDDMDLTVDEVFDILVKDLVRGAPSRRRARRVGIEAWSRYFGTLGGVKAVLSDAERGML